MLVGHKDGTELVVAAQERVVEVVVVVVGLTHGVVHRRLGNLNPPGDLGVERLKRRKVNDRPSGRSVLGHVGVGKLMVFLDVLVIGLLTLPPDHPRPDDKREANHQKDDGSHHEAAPLLFGRLGRLGCRTVPIGRRDGAPTVSYGLIWEP